MNSIRPFLSSESVREEKGNSTVARYILRTGTGSAQARAGIDAMRARLPAGEYRSSLHVQYHPRVGGQSSHHVALHVRVVSASRLRAHTYALTHSHSNTADEQTRYNMCFAAQGAMRTSCRNSAPGSFPPRCPRPSLAPTPPVHLSFLQDSLGGWADRAVPSPRSWETSGPHIREGQPVNLISLDVTSRGPSLCLVFALTGLIGYLVHPCSA